MIEKNRKYLTDEQLKRLDVGATIYTDSNLGGVFRLSFEGIDVEDNEYNFSVENAGFDFAFSLTFEQCLKELFVYDRFEEIEVIKCKFRILKDWVIEYDSLSRYKAQSTINTDSKLAVIYDWGYKTGEPNDYFFHEVFHVAVKALGAVDKRSRKKYREIEENFIQDVCNILVEGGGIYKVEKFLRANEIAEYFKKLRFDKNHHLGMGDIRLTIAQQYEIVNQIGGKVDNVEIREFDKI